MGGCKGEEWGRKGEDLMVDRGGVGCHRGGRADGREGRGWVPQRGRG